MIFIFAWLSMIISRSIDVSVNGLFQFFQWPSSIPLYVCSTTSLSIPLVNGRLVCFCVFAVVNGAAVNTEVFSFRIRVFFSN